MGLPRQQFYTMMELDHFLPALVKVDGSGVLVEVEGGEGDAPHVRVRAAWGLWKEWARNGQNCEEEAVLKVSAPTVCVSCGGATVRGSRVGRPGCGRESVVGQFTRAFHPRCAV